MIPNQFHFVFGLKPQIEPFHIAHFLCLESCRLVNDPDSIHFHCHHEPHGEWWDRIKGRLTLHQLDPVPFVRDHPSYFAHDEGRLIKAWNLDYAHQADFVRLQVLASNGGVYADMDTLFVRKLRAELFSERFVIAEEDLVTSPREPAPELLLCNAFLMSARDSMFARAWLDRMYQVFDGTWNRHSSDEAARLSRVMPGEVRVVPTRHHYRFPCTPEGIRTLLQGIDTDLEDVYSVHLWAHMWWSPLRTDITTFHKGLLTEQFIRTVDTTYNLIARRYLDA